MCVCSDVRVCVCVLVWVWVWVCVMRAEGRKQNSSLSVCCGAELVRRPNLQRHAPQLLTYALASAHNTSTRHSAQQHPKQQHAPHRNTTQVAA